MTRKVKQVNELSPGITKLPNGRYRVRIFGFPARTLDTEEDARIILEDLQRQRIQKKGGVILPSAVKREPLTLGKILETYVKDQEIAGCSPETLRNSRRMQARLIKIFGESHPVPLSDDDARFALQNLPTKENPRPCRYTRGVVSFLLSAHRRARLPLPYFPVIKFVAGNRPTFQEKDVRRVVSVLPASSMERALFATIFFTLCRETEALRLTLQDIDWQGETLRIRQNKGGKKDVLLWMPPALQAELKAWMASREALLRKIGKTSDFLFIGRRGNPMESQLYDKRVKKLRERSGLDTPKGFGWVRNQAATLLGELEIYELVIPKLLRHSPGGVTARYNQAKYETQKREAQARLQGFWDGV